MKSTVLGSGSGYKVAFFEELDFKMKFNNLKKLAKSFSYSYYDKYLKSLVNENQ
ncbi:hypothetical protein N9M44_02865 [Flavobacteriaceae bacterium]|nr:hypothetical protein [Flavobacteriaceae bacterium]|tara:strand:- start:405 stop:566 length:162 start_codon:yes stop_codon:yes gene_type:complete